MLDNTIISEVRIEKNGKQAFVDFRKDAQQPASNAKYYSVTVYQDGWMTGHLTFGRLSEVNSFLQTL